jgi:hypothetical protein
VTEASKEDPDLEVETDTENTEREALVDLAEVEVDK